MISFLKMWLKFSNFERELIGQALEILGPVAQLVASPTADPGVASSIPAWSFIFVEIDHEIILTVTLLLPLIQEAILSVTS